MPYCQHWLQAARLGFGALGRAPRRATSQLDNVIEKATIAPNVSARLPQPRECGSTAQAPQFPLRSPFQAKSACERFAKKIMAARLRKRHQDDVRAKIQASQLINYLQKHSLDNEGSENAATRVRAAQALLNKVVPDVTRNEHTGEGGGPIELKHTW